MVVKVYRGVSIFDTAGRYEITLGFSTYTVHSVNHAEACIDAYFNYGTQGRTK